MAAKDHLDDVVTVELDKRKIRHIVQICWIILLNLFVGASFDMNDVRASLNNLMMAFLNVSRWKCSTLFGIKAWKVSLVLHFLFKPVVAFSIGLVLFKEDSSLRQSLLFLGTSSMGSRCIWIAKLFVENMNPSAFLLLASILLEPLSLLLWWNTLGLLIDDPHFSREVPAVSADIVYVYFAMVAGPILVGMILVWLVPRMEPRLSRASDAIFITGLVVSSILSGLSVQDDAHQLLLSWQIWVGGAGLAFAVSGCGILIGIVAGLPHDHVWVLAIGGIQSTFLIRWIVAERFKSPHLVYTDAFAFAHSTITTAVSLIAFIMVNFGSAKYHDLNVERRILTKLDREQVWTVQEKLHPLWL